jgi:pimeloyl-ACP methyl ester carboxylesterase
MGTLFYWLEEFGYGDLHDTSQYPALVDTLRAATEYTPANIANDDNWRTLYASSPLLSDQTWLYTLDMIDQVPAFEIPVYFLAGRLDYKTPAVLVEEYLAALEAPAKGIVFFESSAHMPNIEEREAFHSALINAVLSGTPE